MEDDIPPIYNKIKTIFKQKCNKLEKKVEQKKIPLLLLKEDTMIVEFEVTSSIYLKYKSGKLC